MGEELALVPGEQAKQLVLDRGQRHRLAGHGDGALLEIDAELADLDDGLGRRRRAAQGRTQSCEQLVTAERLRHVVVRAGVERGDLLPLLADGGKDEDRDGAPIPDLTADPPCRSRLEGERRG